MSAPGAPARSAREAVAAHLAGRCNVAPVLHDCRMPSSRANIGTP